MTHYVVSVDLYIARRRRIHEVRDPNGVAVFHAPHIIQVLEWLVDNDIGVAEFTDDDACFVVNFSRQSSPVTPEKGNSNG